MDTITSIHKELYCQYVYEAGTPETKDILVIVHDQLDYIKQCVESLFQNTDNFTLYLWDNNSMAPTREYLEEVARTHNNVVLVRHSENIGFIKPNNELASLGKSTYIILLNSDTKVEKGWDSALIGWLKENPSCAIVGYQGGTLEEDGRGANRERSGPFIDYVCGWCFCIPRKDIYERFGLFDEMNLSFAYGEDSDFALRMKEAGYEIYALSIKLVTHYGNKTSLEVQKEMDTSVSFDRNHQYIRMRWKDYLENQRITRKVPLT